MEVKPDSEQPLADAAALDNFDSAFSHIRTCRFTCDCGKQYYDCYNTGYDWNEGEYEQLRNDPDWIGVPYSIDIIEIDGREFANACNCWKTRASRIIAWLEHNRSAIATFFRSEKERMLAQANAMEVFE